MLKFCWETEFKETEIGEIPRDWEIRELKDIAKIESGSNAPQEEKYFLNAKYPFIRVKHLNTDKYISDYDLINEEAVRDYNLKLFEKNTIVFAKSGESINLGKYNIIPFDAYIVNHLAIIKNIQNLSEIDFLFYVLIAFDRFVEKDIAGTTLPYLKITDIEKKKIFYPPLPEQSRIATVLSWFDDLIENKRRQNEILEKTAMAIFKSWFIDFEPFKNGGFVCNDELGKEIPKGWEVKKIGEVADLKNGLSYKGSEKFNEQTHGSLIFITLNNIIEGGGFKTEYAWVKSERIKNRHLLKEGDIIFANTEQTKTGRLLGTPAFVIFPTQYSKSAGVFSHHLTKINPKDFRMKYFFYLIFRLYQEEFAQSFHTGTGVWGFDLQNFKTNYYILLPPPHILQSFHSLIEPLFQKIILNQKQIMTLRKIKDTLLPLLVFGKLRVEEI